MPPQTALSSAQFISKVQQARGDGYFFTPLIGAGLSAAAGVPTTHYLQRYLALCYVRAFGLPIPETLHPTRPWNPRRDPWPTFDQAKRLLTKQHLDDALATAAQRRALNKDNHVLTDISSDLLREAYGALADWRTALQLLSRVVPERNRSGGKRRWLIRVREPDSSVVDSFFRHLIKGRQPALGHRLLQALGPVLRFSTILTTNFDELIEEAFAKAGEPLHRFEVALGTDLPAARLVLAQRSIVKLHGGQYSLRANYTLDQPPSRSDILNVLGYLAGRPLPDHLRWSHDDIPDQLEQTALLISGVGIQEERTRGLLTAAIRSFSNIRIFWIAFSAADVAAIHKLWEEAVTPLQKPRRSGLRNREYFVVEHPEHALLLLELYQRCTLDLPPCGTLFPALWNFAFPPLIPEPRAKLIIQRHKLLVERICQLRDDCGTHPLVIWSQRYVYGGVSAASAAFCDARLKDWFRIWLDLDDLATPDGVIFRILLTLAKRCGISDPIIDYNLNHRQQIESQAQRLFELASQLGQPIIVFLNAQQGVGKNSFFDSLKQEWHSENKLAELFTALDTLAADLRFRIRFVVICREKSEFLEHLARHTQGEAWLSEGVRLRESATHFAPTRIVERAIIWAAQERWRQLLLHCLVSYRIGRYVAGLVHTTKRLCEEFGDPSGEDISFSRIADAIERLCALGLLRRKHGGVLWMHYEIREHLLSRIRQDLSALEVNRTEVIIIEHICRGYGRLLLSAAEPMPALEAIRHALRLSEDLLASDATALDSEILSRSVKVLRYARLLCATIADLLERRVTDQLIDLMLKEVSDRAIALSNSAATAKTIVTELVLLRNDLVRLRLRTLQHQSEFPELLQAIEMIEGLDPKNLSLEVECYRAAAYIGLRSYSEAEKAAINAWHLLWDKPFAINFSHSPTALARELLTSNGKGDRDMRASRASLVASRLGYCYLNASQALYLYKRHVQKSSSTVKSAEAERSNVLLKAKFMFEFSLEALRLRPNVGTKTFRPNARLRAHLALTYALLAGRERKAGCNPDGRWLSALKALSDAEAFVIEYPAPADALSRAILEMRRAEILLIQVSRDSEFRRERNTMWRIFENRSQPKRTRAIVGSERLRASLYEAFRALERAETYLVSYPKSRWWWWILIVLRAKVAAALMVLRWSVCSRCKAFSAEDRMIPPEVRLFLNEQVQSSVIRYSMSDFFEVARLVTACHTSTVAQILYLADGQRRRINQDLHCENISRGAETLRFLNMHLKRLLAQQSGNTPAQEYARKILQDSESFPLHRLEQRVRAEDSSARFTH